MVFEKMMEKVNSCINWQVGGTWNAGMTEEFDHAPNRSRDKTIWKHPRTFSNSAYAR